MRTLISGLSSSSTSRTPRFHHRHDRTSVTRVYVLLLLSVCYRYLHYTTTNIHTRTPVNSTKSRALIAVDRFDLLLFIPYS
ncbi:hypothetical protein Y032_0011g1325 [Ancylostoma ceylanicum]|uniref:Uncharacterized protein n=1 Tax=Ancylostoma ceylanicum TaxID=53326 RepID=A0A016VFZ6_9BILA|nr:hypothetical protein Y032_0011g1325 [Ancylostoma ceylanicum]